MEWCREKEKERRSERYIVYIVRNRKNITMK